MSFILNPNKEKEEFNVSSNFIECLEFDFLAKAGKKEIINKYLTDDPEVIDYRQKLFGDLTNNPDFIAFLDELIEKTEAIIQLQSMSRELRDSGNNESLFTSFRELLFFTECVDCITAAEKKFRGVIESPGINALFDKIGEISKKDWYTNAKNYVETACNELKDIQSITLGVNLDAQLGVQEVGVVSINTQKFTTNTIFDKLFSKKITDRNYVCVAAVGGQEVRNSGVSLQKINEQLYHAISDTLGVTLKKIKQTIYSELIKSMAFLCEIHDDLLFISMCVNFILTAKSSGMPLCIPSMSESEHIIEGLYNPNLINRIKPTQIVKNDLKFDSTGMIYLLTGANSGGKTMFLRSVGIAQVLFQLGLPVPAKSAKMQVCKEIFTHFSSKVSDKVGGRFENECKSILTFYKQVTEKSLVLVDEMFSTTSSSEGAVLASHVLSYFSEVGCKCIFTTHIHDLLMKVDELNSSEKSKSQIKGISVEVINNTCTYKINYDTYSYGSYAEEICKKYGFDF